MTPELFLAQKAAEAIRALYSVEVDPATLQVQVTRKEFEGDYTLVIFPLLRITHASPENTGKAIGDWLQENVPEVSGYNCVKGFLNILLSAVYWNNVFRTIATDPAFGTLPSTGRTVMVEFSSPNTNKPLHLGHIRNNLLGDSVSRILAASGNKVIKARPLRRGRRATIWSVTCTWLSTISTRRKWKTSWPAAWTRKPPRKRLPA